MYEEHPIFASPDAEDAKIWRYMDFTKFVSILDRQELFFVRLDRLSDGHEGSYSYFNIKNRPNVYKGEGSEKLLEIIPMLSEEGRKLNFVNSWHLNPYKSAAMWRLYAKNDESIAIQSTYKKLKECFDGSPEKIFIGKVSYIDYDTEWMPEGNILYPVLHKRKSFEYEKELRAVILKIPPERDGKIYLYQNTPDAGMYVKIEVTKLIERVYVSPTAPDWFYDLTKSIVGKYNYEFDVLKSDLCRDSVY